MKPNWKKLPIGTVLRNNVGHLVETTCEFFVPRGFEEGPRSGYYAVRGLNGFTQPTGRATVNPPHSWTIDPSSFADAYRRDALAKAGFFSVDDPVHRQRRSLQEVAASETASAYDRLGLDRDLILTRVAGVLDAQRTDGIWATSTIEYAKKREALDNAVRYAAGVANHA